jgi:1,4-dihydroxy-2-naphthoate octaprenyltransferase
MWRKALNVIPRVTKEEWQQLDIISRWLISTRAAVLIMTFISGAIAGILAIQAGKFNFWHWLLLELGLILSHATNNLFNDYIDYVKGVDRDNYFRAQYGPQPLEHGLLTKGQLLTYALITGLLAALPGIYFVYVYRLPALILLGLGIFFVLFYTYPLKYIALGELSVLIVWGPLMIAGGYFVITGTWDWSVVIASLPYALGVTTVIFGKHIDKHGEDKAKGIHTLPVVIGEKASRVVVLSMVALQYLSVAYLTLTGFFTPILLVVFLALGSFGRLWNMYRYPKPEREPENYPPNVWPIYFVGMSFYHNRRFGLLYLLGLILDTMLRYILPGRFGAA